MVKEQFGIVLLKDWMANPNQEARGSNADK